MSTYYRSPVSTYYRSPVSTYYRSPVSTYGGWRIVGVGHNDGVHRAAAGDRSAGADANHAGAPQLSDRTPCRRAAHADARRNLADRPLHPPGPVGVPEHMQIRRLRDRRHARRDRIHKAIQGCPATPASLDPPLPLGVLPRDASRVLGVACAANVGLEVAVRRQLGERDRRNMI
ncbi:MAG: hypothetical protein AB7Q17_14245 [Phycisphaerae bacterium]